GYIPPSTSIIMPRCFTARTNIHTSMIAVVPGKNWTIEKITLPGEAISASGYSPAVVVDDFVFVAGNQAFVESGELGPGVAIARAHLGRRERVPPPGALRDQGAARAVAEGGGIGARAQPQGAGLHPRRRQLPRFHGGVVAVFPQHCVRGDAGAGKGLFQHREHARDQPDRAQDRRHAQKRGGGRRHSRARDLWALPARGRIGLPVRPDGGCARRARPRRRQRGGLRRARPCRIRPGRLASRLRAGGLRGRRRLHGQRRARAVLPDRHARFRRRRRRGVRPLWEGAPPGWRGCRCPPRSRPARPPSSATSGFTPDAAAAPSAAFGPASRIDARQRAQRACYDCPNSDAGSTFTPGPMVEEIATRLMKVPLAPAGRAFCTASANALMFCTRWSAGNDALPTPACTMPAFSTRNSTEPLCAPLTAVVTSMVPVPTFGFGIMPRGPNTLPSRPTSGMRSGVAMQRSKSMLPPCTFSTRSSAPTTSAPAALASSALAPRANT